MALTTDIAASYIRPRTVAAGKVAVRREDVALMYLMLGCTLVFVGRWPAIQRAAYLEGEDFGALFAGTLFAWIFVTPVLLYLISWLVHLGSRVLRQPVAPFGSRMALFWALLAASPLWLLNGLTEGMIGPSPALTLVGVLAVGAFMWFWVAGLIAARAVEARARAA